MVFSSIIFIFYFLPIFLFFYYLTGARNAMLLLGSVIFYTWGEGPYLLLLLSQIGVNFWLGHHLTNQQAHKRKLWIIAAVTLNLTILGLFKYLGFLGHVASNILQIADGKELPDLTLHLPLGISFFTFQLISYQIDVYRGAVQAERSFSRFATYILMFPHLIAGPIVRYADIADELGRRRIDSTKLWLGLQYLIVGLAQKVMIANSVAPLADAAFAMSPDDLTTAWAWAGITAYTLQIFYDFCGYSNMAIGLAFLLGFHFPLNFNYPYCSRSITEFWRRWHISLSSWFRDYVYIPLGGNRGGTIKTLRNLIIVFFLTGFWHGAAWNFIIWGLFHGAALLLERAGFSRILAKIPAPFSWAYSILIVMIGWVFFRADNLPHASYYLTAMFRGYSKPLEAAPIMLFINPEVIAATLAGIVLAFPWISRVRNKLRHQFVVQSHLYPDQHSIATSQVYALPVTWLLLIFVLSIALLAANTLNPFLYFRF